MYPADYDNVLIPTTYQRFKRLQIGNLKLGSTDWHNGRSSYCLTTWPHRKNGVNINYLWPGKIKSIFKVDLIVVKNDTETQVCHKFAACQWYTPEDPARGLWKDTFLAPSANDIIPIVQIASDFIKCRVSGRKKVFSVRFLSTQQRWLPAGGIE